MYFVTVLDTKDLKYSPMYDIPLTGCADDDEAVDRAKIIRSTLDKRYTINIQRIVNVSVGYM